MNVLVTGGAGYIGSVVAGELLNHGYGVIVVDNLKQGHRKAVPPGARLFVGDISEPGLLDCLFQGFRVDAVVHMAAESLVGQSMSDPSIFFRGNVVDGICLLNAMRKHEVSNLVFSSSAAVYGEPMHIPVKEDHSTIPVNAYGESKLMFEHVMEWYAKAYGLHFISLRYFNAAGATDCAGEDHRPETHLIPNVIRVAMNGDRPVTVFGTNYPTKDGSCIRDYIHVSDIAQAHVLALDKIDKLSGQTYNLGSDAGCSVLEVIDTVKRVTNTEVPICVTGRRLGDPAILVASSERAKQELGWEPKLSSIEHIVESTWSFMKEHPHGYGE